MKTICTDVYTFDELNDKAKDKAREWYRSASADDDFWSECVIDNAVTGLAFLGWEVGKPRRGNSGHAVYFSGFWSQGDGACFEGEWNAKRVNVAAFLDHVGMSTDNIIHAASGLAAIAKQFPAASGSVRHKGHYSHEHCTEFSFDDNDDAALDLIYESPEYLEHCKKVDAAREEFEECSRAAMRWIYRCLGKEYEYSNSDEVVDENIRANEYTFTESGERFG